MAPSSWSCVDDITYDYRVFRAFSPIAFSPKHVTRVFYDVIATPNVLSLVQMLGPEEVEGPAGGQM